MSIELITIILFGGMITLLALGVPVVFAIGGISVALIFWVMGTPGLFMIAATTYRELTDITLFAIPLFVLMGQFLFHSGMSDHLFKMSNYWLSGVRGNLAMVSVVVCVALAMCGGFGPGLITMGLIAVPAMLNRNYNKGLALGSVMGGGVLGDLIPPSIIMIFFAYITRLSVGRLFFGGVVPGLITAGFYMLYIVIRCRLQPQLAPEAAEHVSWKVRWVSLRQVVIPFLLIIAVLGSIFAGIATPVEAAGIGAFGALITCFIYRRFSWKMLVDSCRATLKVSCMALWILVAATLFGVFFTKAGAQGMVMDIIGGLEINRWFILIGMQFILLVFGMFMDDYAIITICAPIFLPVAVSLGFDPIWFAIVFILNMQVAYLTPPFGWALIIMKGIAPPGVSTGDIWRSTPPFVLIQLLVLILIMTIPALATWLPGLMV